MREKLIEIFKQALFEGKVLDEWWWEEKIAMIVDHLIANGVTIQQWIPASEPPKEDGKYLVRKLIFDRTSIIEVLSYAHDGEKVDKYDLKGEKNVWYNYDSEVDNIRMEKPPAIVYIDDRAICFDGNTATLLGKIQSFKPWNK